MALLMSHIVLVVVCVGVGEGQSPLRPGQKEFIPVGQLDRSVIKESSGIAKSSRHKGIFWTHNDSGNAPELFAVRADGELVAKVPVVDAPNIDWEDIAIADGFIYVGDIGNNMGWLRVRTVYKFAEPDSFRNDIKPLKPIATYRYKYPGDPFDAEGLLVRGEHIYITRKAGGKASAIYLLTPTGGEYMILAKVQTLPSGRITGASLSDDGRFLVTVTGYRLCLYPVNDDLTLRKDQPTKCVSYPPKGQIEACCFDGGDVIVTAEKGAVYRISAQDIQQQIRFVSPRSTKSVPRP